MFILTATAAVIPKVLAAALCWTVTVLHLGKERSFRSRPVCCVSVQGLHPLKDSAFVVFEGESFRETLFTSSAVVKWDGLAFGAFPVDDLRHAMSSFSLFLSSFSGAQRILGYVRPRRIVVVHPPKTGKRRPHLEEPSDWDGLRAALRRNWPSNAPLEDADPRLRHSCLRLAVFLCSGLIFQNPSGLIAVRADWLLIEEWKQHHGGMMPFLFSLNLPLAHWEPHSSLALLGFLGLPTSF